MRKLKVVPAFMVLALALGACASEASDAAVDDAAPVAALDQSTPEAVQQEATSVQLALQDEVFAPEALEAPAGSEVTVEVTNEGNNPHTFTVGRPRRRHRNAPAR